MGSLRRRTVGGWGRRHLTYSNVMSTVAVFAVLGGGAYAASEIGSDDIAKNAILLKHIKRANARDADPGAVASSGVTGVSRNAGQTGFVFVDFNRDITSCAVLASGSENTNSFPPTRNVQANVQGNRALGSVFDLNSAVDEDFAIAAFC